MKVFVDGKEVECNEDVVVVYDAFDEEEDRELYLKCTYEGIIADMYDGDGEVCKSMWQTVDDLVEMTH